jgi:hypothetical protein
VAAAESGLHERGGGALATVVWIRGGAHSSMNVRSTRTTTTMTDVTTMAALEVDEHDNHVHPNTEDGGAPTLGGR